MTIAISQGFSRRNNTVMLECTFHRIPISCSEKDDARIRPPEGMDKN
jgi:hypothetical protein